MTHTDSPDCPCNPKLITIGGHQVPIHHPIAVKQQEEK